MFVKLSNNHTIYFAEKLKGKHYLALNQGIGSMLGIDAEKMVTNPSAPKLEKMDMGQYFKSVIELFPVFVDRIDDEHGNDVIPTMEYYYELDYSDADLVYQKLAETLNQVQQKKIKN